VVQFDLGNALHKLSQFEEADAAYRRTLKTKSSGLAAKAWYNLGNNYLQQGKFAEALPPYQEALKKSPRDEDTLNNLALALRFLKKPPSPKSQNQPQPKPGQGKGEGSQDKNSQDQKSGSGQFQKSQKPAGPDDKGEKKADKKDESASSQGQNQATGGKTPKPGEMSPEDAGNLLDAIRESEKDAQQKRLSGSLEKGKKGRLNVPEDW